MDEPALRNDSDFHASVLPILDRDGAHARIVIVKAAYAIRPGEPLEFADEPREPRLGDEMWGPPEVADIRWPADFCIAKPGTDFVLSAHAVAARQGVDTFVDVGIRVADRARVLRVHGAREWRRTVGGVAPGPAAVIREPIPLAWSRAYGGLDLSDPARPIEEPRNPVGSGIAHDVNTLVGRAAPQIEAPDAPVDSAGARSHVPVGCAPIGRTFEPRRRAAGTYDAAWLEQRYPARPSDYDASHENCAAPDWRFAEPLRGGEPVRIAGVSPLGAIEFALPKWRVVVQAAIDGKVIEQRPHLDTVLVDGDARVVELVWRALFRCPPKMHDRFTAIRVAAKEFAG